MHFPSHIFPYCYYMKMLPVTVYIKCNDAWIIVLHENYTAQNYFDKFSRLLYFKSSNLWFFSSSTNVVRIVLIRLEFTESIKCLGILYDDNFRGKVHEKNLENLIVIRPDSKQERRREKWYEKFFRGTSKKWVLLSCVNQVNAMRLHWTVELKPD